MRLKGFALRTVQCDVLFGCHIGVMKRIFGGKRGYSGGKLNRALKNPPSLQRINAY